MADTQLKWNVDGKRIYQTGVDRGVLFADHGTGVAWEGLTKVAQSPEGAEATDIYANNLKYGTLRSAEKFKFTISAYDAPKEWDQCDGTKEVLIDSQAVKGLKGTGQTRVPFDFSYRTLKGNDQKSIDYGYLLHLVYNATAAVSSSEYGSINDSVEAIEFSWECATTPVDVPGLKPTAHLIVDSTTADPTKFKKLEDILYGAAAASRMPTPTEVANILSKVFPS